MYEFFCSALDRPWLLGCELRDWLSHIGVEPSTVPPQLPYAGVDLGLKPETCMSGDCWMWGTGLASGFRMLMSWPWT